MRSRPVAGWGDSPGCRDPSGSRSGGTPPPWPSTPLATSTWARWPGRSARSTRGRSRCAGPSRRRGCPPTSVSWCSPANNVLVAAGNEALLAVDLVSGRRLWVADLRGGLFPEPCPFFAVAEGVGRVYCGNYFGQVEERDLATGQRTDIRLDPQLGSVGDLVVAGSEGTELVGFAAGEAAYSRWRLDGSNLVARLRVDDAAAPIGYDPSGSYLLVRGQPRGLGPRPRGPGDGRRRRRGRHRRPGGGSPGCERVRVGRRRAAGLLGAARRRTDRRREPTHRRAPGPGVRDGERVRRPSGRDGLGDHRGRWSNRGPGARPRDRDRPRAVRRGRRGGVTT